MNESGCVRNVGRWISALLLLAAMETARAQSLDLPRLMQLLAAVPATEVAFTEKKFSSLLAAPVVSSGKLHYRRPDIVEKNIESPRKETYRFAGEELVMTRDGKERRIPLSSQPLLAAFAASLRGVLGGDIVLLRRHYELSLQGDEASWRLDMTPLDEETLKFVMRVTVSGRAGRVGKIEVRESSGDHSVLQVR
ncbi:MAG: outer membrane lipoprotein carrier protein LolA [Burkholderiales bacterium]|nr:outer membrane lipoprotein carrier protein LolA [Burkholderiales bacterium]